MQCGLVLVVALYVGMVHSWDIATTPGDDKLHFYTNETLTSTINIESRTLSALTYDAVHNMMLYVDKQTDNDTICGYDLTSIENKCFTHGSGRNIHGLAFDPVTELVFFTDTNERSVNWISLKPGSNDNINGNLLIKVDDGIPRDIVVDSCEGYVYWLKSNLTKPTVERARLNGTKREVFQTLTTFPVNETFKLEPYGLGIDLPKRWIYWLGPAKTTEYRLFASALNRNLTTFVMHLYSPKLIKAPTNTLVVSKNFIMVLPYAFQAKAVFSFPKTFAEFKMKKVYLDKNAPISMVSNNKIKDQIENCKALSRVKMTTEYDRPFCVHGTKVNEEFVCKCTPGYTGERCDMSICENYCSHGNCSFNDEGLPECSCNAGYFGDRCDISMCENYCLRGNCSLNDARLPECRCNTGYYGERCQFDVCRGYCLNNGSCSLNEEDEPFCECGEGYQGTQCEDNVDLNDTITISVSHRKKTSVLVVP